MKDGKIETPWEDIEENTLLGITDKLAQLVAFAREELDDTRGLQDRIDLSPLDLTITLTHLETHVITLGLHLVGFFSEEHSELAIWTLNRLMAEREKVDATADPLFIDDLAAALNEVRKDRAAEMLGMHREEFDASLDAVRKDIEEARKNIAENG